MSALFPWLLALWVKGSILLILALVTDRLLRRAPAHTRHAMWTATFVVLLVLPILSALLPALPVPGLSLPFAASVQVRVGEPVALAAELAAPSGPSNAPTRSVGANVAGTAAPGGMTRQSQVIVATPPNGRRSASMVREVSATLVDRLIESAPASVIRVWAAGALAALTLLLVSFRRAARLVARARELLDIDWRTDLRRARAMLGMRETVRLRASPQIGTPMAGGLLRGVVLVPDLARRWSAERRRFVLLHELVHLSRRDPVRHLVARLALVLHWPNPLAWLAAHRAMVAREEACDEQVLALGAKPSSYARELLELNELLHSPTSTRIAVLPMIQRSQMEKRVMNILRSNRRPLRRPMAIALVAVASVATLSVAAAAPQEPKRVVKVKPVVEVKVVPEIVETVAPEVAVRAEVTVAPQVVVTVPPQPSVVIAVRPIVSVAPQTSVEIAVRPIVWVAPMPMIGSIATESVCTPERYGSFSGSRSIRGGRDGDSVIYQQIGTQNGDFIFIKRFDEQLVCMRTEGDVEVNRETGAIARIGAGGLVVWEAQHGNTVQRLEVRAGDGYLWSINGDERAFDSDARAWYDAMREVVAGQWAIVTLRGEVATKRGEMASIRGQRASVRGQMASVRGQVASMRGQIASTHGQGATMRGKMASIRGEAASMRGAVASERGVIASLNARRHDADAQELADIESRIKKHEARIEKLEREIDVFAVEARVREVERELDSAELERMVAVIEEQISEYDLEGKLAQLERVVEALELESNIARIEAEIEAMNAAERIEELEAQLAPAMERLERLIEQTR